MKKQSSYVILLIFISLIVASACNEQDDFSFIEDNLQESSSTKDGIVQNDDAAIAAIDIKCTGNCEPGEHPDPQENSCAAMLYDGAAGTLECPCEDCAMVFSSTDNIASKSKDYLSKNSKYIRYFNEHLSKKFGNTNVYVYEVSIKKYDSVETVWFNYKSIDTQIPGSVMYITKFDETGKVADPTVEIECTGDCDDPEETCRERYILSTGDAECTCEGSCKMKVTYKDS